MARTSQNSSSKRTAVPGCSAESGVLSERAVHPLSSRASRVTRPSFASPSRSSPNARGIGDRGLRGRRLRRRRRWQLLRLAHRREPVPVVRAVAERLVLRAAAAAERDDRPPGEPVRAPLPVDELDLPFDAKRPVVLRLDLHFFFAFSFSMSRSWSFTLFKNFATRSLPGQPST